ncbi:hypothetical protein Tco_0369592 [Tanacetum coccineum]
MSWIDSFVPVDSEVVKGSKDRAEGSETRAEGSSKRAQEDLQQESTKKQKMDDDKKKEELKKCFEIVPDDGDDVTIDATPLADGKTQMYLTFSKMLKNFDREDLEVLWRIVKARFKKTEPVNYMDTFLHLNMKTMFEHHVEDMQTIPYYLLVEKMYSLTKHKLHQMFNIVKLQVDYASEMAYELLRLGRIVGIKRLLSVVEVTAAGYSFYCWYLKGQTKLSLWYPKDSPFDLIVYTNSDYAGASLDRKSTTGGCQFLRCRLISWQCKKQTVVANSTTEAEYVAASRKAKKSVKLMMEKLFRMELELMLSSDPSENIADEAVYKELGDSLVRAATTASSLEAEQDSDNITKTQSKATPNESSSIGTTSGGGPRVLDLEKTKTTQANEIASLKRRVKKLEKKIDEEINLVSVQDDADKEMFDVDALNGEEVFVAGQIENVIEEVVDAAQVKGIVFQEPGKSTTTTISSQQSQDKGKGILIEPVEPMKKKDLIRLDEEVSLKLQAEFDEEERLAREKAEKEKEANISLIEIWDDIQAKIDADHQLAERFQAQEQEELSVEEKATLFQQLLDKRRKHFEAKRAEEKRNKPPTKSQQKKIMCTYLKNMEGYKLNDLKLKEFDSIQEMFDRAFKRVNTFKDFRTELVEGKEKRAGTKLAQETTKKQKVEDDKETTDIKKLMEIIPDEEEIAIDAIPLAVKSPSIVDSKIHKEGRKNYYQIIRADGKSQMYMIFSHMLKSFDRDITPPFLTYSSGS